jgi:hypothetical protein
MISAEAPVLFAKAAEIFISELSLRAWIHTEEMFELCQNLLILTDTMYYFELNKRFKITEETF